METDSDKAQEESQAALDYISVQDPDNLKPKEAQKAQAKMRHIFDAPDVVAPIPKKEDEPYVASKLLDDETIIAQNNTMQA